MASYTSPCLTFPDLTVVAPRSWTRRWVTTVVFVFVVSLTSATHAGVILESATLGATGNTGGVTINSNFYSGTWFSLDQETRITGLGGHVGLSNSGAAELSVWAAIIELAPGNVPTNGFDLEANSLVSGLLTGTSSSGSQDRRVSVDSVLGPGDYAIVIGGRPLFGATTVGWMPRNNINLPGADYFGRANNGWEADNSLHRNLRFVVEGTPTITAVPEPSSILLWTVLGVCSLRRCRPRS